MVYFRLSRMTQTQEPAELERNVNDAFQTPRKVLYFPRDRPFEFLSSGAPLHLRTLRLFRNMFLHLLRCVAMRKSCLVPQRSHLILTDD